MAEDDGRFPKPSTFVAQMIEYMKAESCVAYLQQCVMMDLEDYIEFARTRRGGRLQLVRGLIRPRPRPWVVITPRATHAPQQQW